MSLASARAEAQEQETCRQEWERRLAQTTPAGEAWEAVTLHCPVDASPQRCAMALMAIARALKVTDTTWVIAQLPVESTAEQFGKSIFEQALAGGTRDKLEAELAEAFKVSDYFRKDVLNYIRVTAPRHAEAALGRYLATGSTENKPQEEKLASKTSDAPTAEATATRTPQAKLSAVEQALILIARNPNRSNRDVAREIGCDPSTLSHDNIRRLRNVHAGILHKGSKTKKGDLEAESDVE